MKPNIILEAESFLEKHPLVSARMLAIEAGIKPNNLTRVLSGSRADMASAKADKLREAMRRLSHAFTPASPASTPAPPSDSPHAAPPA